MTPEVDPQKTIDVDLRVVPQVAPQVAHNKKKNNTTKKGKKKYTPKSRKGVLFTWDRKRVMDNLTDAQKDSLRGLCNGDKAYMAEILSQMDEYWLEEDPDEQRDHNHWVNTIRTKIRHKIKKGFGPEEPEVDMGELEADMQKEVLAELRG